MFDFWCARRGLVQRAVAMRAIVLQCGYLGVVLCMAGVFATPTRAQVLFSDDFTNASLNTTSWGVGNWQLGRTQLGNTPTMSGGVASLTLDTYNPSNTTLLRGTEIYSKQTFGVGASGLDFEARVRTNMTAAGAVTSFFTYTGLGTPASPAQEIDYEALTKQIGQNKVLATTWNNWTGASGQYNDGIHHKNNDPASSAGQTPAGVNLTGWNTFRIRWLPNSTEWSINDVLFYQTTAAHPTDAMPIRFNFWAPDSSWTAAYDGGLTPATTLAGNTSYTYDVDYVRVSVVPEPSGLIAVAAIAGLGFRRIRRRIPAA
jgi:beta-glucanase (GH16 family)